LSDFEALANIDVTSSDSDGDWTPNMGLNMFQRLDETGEAEMYRP